MAIDGDRGATLNPAVYERRPFIATYIMASRPMGVLYVGSTSNLYQRVAQHRQRRLEGFTKDHGCGMLVWFQPFERMTSARRREAALKGWNRPWKMELIERTNPEWRDLYPFLIGEEPDPRIPPL